MELQITQRWARALPNLYRASGVNRRGSVVLNHDEGPIHERQNFFPHASQTPRGPTTSERMRLYMDRAPSLALQACRKSILDSQIAPECISHLVTVSCSGFNAPGVDIDLIEGLKLSETTQRTHVGFMGCHGAMNGMRIADSIVRAGSDNVVLMCATELCSIHQPYTDDPQQLVAASLFADGAASIVITRGEQTVIPAPDPSMVANRWRLVDFASCIIPGTRDLMSWNIGDFGFEMSLSPKVPDIIQQRLRTWLEPWLQTRGIPIETISRWLVHPGGPKVLDAVESSLSLESHRLATSREVLNEHGNMSSPTVLMILDRSGVPKKDEYAVLLAFGPGLCIEGALLQGA